MRVLVLTPYLNYESFDEVDRNPLTKLRVIDVSDEAKYRAGLMLALREVLDGETLLTYPRKPEEPSVKLSEVSADRLAELQASYERVLAQYEEQVKQDELVEAFFDGGEDNVSDEQLEVWLQAYYASVRDGDVCRIYFTTTE